MRDYFELAFHIYLDVDARGNGLAFHMYLDMDCFGSALDYFGSTFHIYLDVDARGKMFVGIQKDVCPDAKTNAQRFLKSMGATYRVYL
jgi:hypothetical protein